MCLRVVVVLVADKQLVPGFLTMSAQRMFPRDVPFPRVSHT